MLGVFDVILPDLPGVFPVCLPGVRVEECLAPGVLPGVILRDVLTDPPGVLGVTPGVLADFKLKGDTDKAEGKHMN